MTEMNDNAQNTQQEKEKEYTAEKTYIVNESTTSEQPLYVSPPIIEKESASTVSILEWVLAIIVMCIPVVNMIMLFVFAFTGNKESKKNYFKARLILIAASIVASIIFFVVMIIVLGPRIPEIIQDLQDLITSYGY